MSTLRTDTLQTTDSSYTVNINQLANTADFTNTADPAKGAGNIGRNVQVVSSIAALKLLLKTSVSKWALVTGYRADADGGFGIFALDLSDTTSADNGGTIFVAADGGRWKLVQNGPVTIKQFGAIAGVFDGATQTINNTAFQAARDWVAANATRNKLDFQSGIYAYSTSPNWAIQNGRIEAQGEVRLRYFGTGNAVILDGTGQPNQGCYNNRMYGFMVEAPATAQNGVLVKACHHSNYKFKVRGAGPTYAGIKTEFCVVTRFDDPEVSPNSEGGWYTGAMPRYGLHITGGVGTQTSYCTFTNPICEGLAEAVNGAGIFLEGALGNNVQSGTAEGCTIGLLSASVASGCVDNKYYGIDLEANTTYDIYEQGQGTEFYSVNSTLKLTVVSGARRPKFFGGRHMNIEVALGAIAPNFQSVIFNRDGIAGTGTFVNGEPSTITHNCTDEKNNVQAPYSQFNVTVTTGVFTYTNTSGNPVLAMLSGGTVSAVAIGRAAVDNGASNVAGQYWLAPGDYLKITNSVAPTLRILTQ